MAEGAVFYLVEEPPTDQKAAGKFLKADALPLLDGIAKALAQQDDYGEEALNTLFSAFTREQEVKLGKVAMPVRVALTGSNVSPGLFEVISILGKEKVLERLRRAIDKIRSSS
jgi:glutamyl-tRNA synthetase